MSDEDGLDSQSYHKNYKVLKDTADWLSKQDEPDIDQLVPRVEKAMRAYQICKDRLSKVQTTLGQYFQEAVPEAPPSADGDRQRRRASRPGPEADGEDEDIRF